jgi:hypothetical protein
MSEGQSQRSVALSAQHQQEAEVAAAEERERAAARAARLAMVKLAAARAEVEAVAAAAELKALRVSSIDNSVSVDDDRDSELKLPGRQCGSRRCSGQPHTPRGAVAAALTGADVPATRGRVPNGGGSPDRRGRASG